MSKDCFSFKRFTVYQDRCAMKVGTDGVLLGAWAQGGKSVLDIGTGTGLVALMMAQRFPFSSVEAIDIDGECCIQAEENVANSPFLKYIHIYRASLQNFFNENRQIYFDAIVSNPPYFVNSLKSPDGKRTAARHSDSLPFSVLLRISCEFLGEGGTLSVVLPIEARNGFVTEAFHLGLYVSREVKIRTTPKKDPSRVLLEFQKQFSSLPDATEVTLMELDGTRSSWYRQLTGDFYLDK